MLKGAVVVMMMVGECGDRAVGLDCGDGCGGSGLWWCGGDGVGFGSWGRGGYDRVWVLIW